MRRKYLEEAFELFDDGAGSLFIGLNTTNEKEINIINFPPKELKELTDRYNMLLEKYIEICLDYAGKHPEDFELVYYKFKKL